MRATSIGHAGLLVETRGVSILCDPWFVPAFFGSWFPFPRNDELSDDLVERIERADFLYVSHLHGDHHDEPWLRAHLRRDIPILLPGLSDPRATAHAGRPRVQRVRPHGRHRGDRDRTRVRVAIHIEIVDHRRARRRLGPRGDATASRSSSTRTTAGPTTSPSSAHTARSTCTGCSSPAPSGTRWSTRWPTT